MKDIKHFTPETSSSFENISFSPRIERKEMGLIFFIFKCFIFKCFKYKKVKLCKRN